MYIRQFGKKLVSLHPKKGKQPIFQNVDNNNNIYNI